MWFRRNSPLRDAVVEHMDHLHEVAVQVEHLEFDVGGIADIDTRRSAPAFLAGTESVMYRQRDAVGDHDLLHVVGG